MAEMILEMLLDIGKSVPFLFAVYLILEWMQVKSKNHKIDAMKMDKYGPLLASASGCIPQCGFSIMAATLYSNKVIRGGTLIAAFIATSDEAIPIIISSGGNFSMIFFIIGLKLFFGIIVGYMLNFTFFRKDLLGDIREVDVEINSCENEHHHDHHHEPKSFILKSALYHTFRISAYILIVLFIINAGVLYLGEERLSLLLLSGSFMQPFVIGVLGMVPGCTTSVLITELLLAGQIPFGSAMAGLCTSTGFGYLILFKTSERKNVLKILSLTYLSGSMIGFLINLL